MFNFGWHIFIHYDIQTTDIVHTISIIIIITDRLLSVYCFYKHLLLFIDIFFNKSLFFKIEIFFANMSISYIYEFMII